MKRKILVIDDDWAIRKSFLLTFEDSDYDVDVATNGEQGVEKAMEGKYDLIFLDLKMPGMDGVDTLSELQRLDPEIPIFIITAFHQEYLQKLKKWEQEGMDFDVLQKPLDSEQLRVLVQGLLEEPAEY